MADDNKRLRAAREHAPSRRTPGACLGRQELADLMNQWIFTNRGLVTALDKNYIGKLERGLIRWPDDNYRAALRAILGVTNDAELGFYDSRRMPAWATAADRDRFLDAASRPSDAWAELATGPRMAVQGHPNAEGEITNRRQLLAGSVLGFAAAATGDAGRADEIDTGLTQALLDVSGQYRRAYQAVPASALLPAVFAHQDLVMSLRPAWRPPEQRQQLLTAASEMAALAGVLLGLDARRYTEALSSLDTAWAAARAAGSVELEAVVLGCRSFVLANGYGNHPAGLEYADFARHIAIRGASPRTRGWVAAVASERCASLGDTYGCMTRLEESRQALETDDAADVPWRGIGSYDDDKLRAYEGGDLVRLRRYREAEASLDAALANLQPGMTRHRATALLDRAEARLGAGNVDAACDDTAQALNLVTQVEHTGHIDRIETLTTRAVNASTRAAQELHEQVQLTRVDFRLAPRMEST